MKFKLDENLSPALTSLFDPAQHDADSVLAENISGASDEELFAICGAEKRVLITLDLDFANVLRFPPAASAGILVLRTHSVTQHAIRLLLEKAVQALSVNDIRGKLWIVEASRIRIHGDAEDDEH